MSKFYNVGKIVNTHGVQGEVRVITQSDFAEDRYQQGSLLYLFQEEQLEELPLTVAAHRVHKNFDLLMFEGYSNINDVLPFKGALLKVKEEDRSLLDQDEYYYDQIIGCQVMTKEGESLGKIKEILSPGANDVWVIQRDQPGKDILIPYIDEVVLDVDLQKRMITIHLLEGLI